MSADTVLAPLRAALDACRATVQVRLRPLPPPVTPRYRRDGSRDSQARAAGFQET